MTNELSMASRRGIVVATFPVAAAIGVFGVIYGAAAQPVIGAPMTVISSVLVFSGAAQFTMIALIAAGATPLGVLGGVTTLALRHLPLGAVLQPRLDSRRWRRVLTSFFLIDETTGIALTQDGPVEPTLTISGALAYTSWVGGTVIGVTGGSLTAVEPLADALFPVLFIGLAALTISTPSDRGRALLAGAATVLLLLAWPGAGALGAIAVAVGVASMVRPA